MEGELEHAERVRLVRFAVGNEVGEDAMRVLAARAYDKFANAMLRISFSVWILEREAFVIMIVAVNYDVCAGMIQKLPKWLDLNVIAMGQAGTEQRLVKIGQRASGHTIRQVLLQPLPLLGGSGTSAHRSALAVQRDDVPLSEIVTVIGLCWVAGYCPEVANVT